MKPDNCSRAWEAEALDDGRLTGPDRASFERHAAVCPACRAQLTGLKALRAKLALVAPPSRAPLEHQRLRARLLERANTLATRQERRPRLAFIAALVALVALALGIGVGIFRPKRRVEHPATTAIVPPRFDAQSSPDASWLPHTSGGSTRVELLRGSVSFTVPHLEPTQEFFVTLPDGEIEVRGTAFTVVVEEGRTVSVNVTAGVVAVRIRGTEERRLHAGDVWPPAVSHNDSTPAATASGTRPPAASPHPHGSGSARAASPPRASAGYLFDEAFASFERGAYGPADLQFERFVREYPADPRAEDASYLRAIARLRLGDRQGAAVLARAYLEAYPAGLRRPEARRLADPTQP